MRSEKNKCQQSFCGAGGPRLSDSPLLQTSGNPYFLSDVMDTLQSLQ